MSNAKKVAKYLLLADMQTIFALSLPMVGNQQRFRTLNQLISVFFILPLLPTWTLFDFIN